MYQFDVIARDGLQFVRFHAQAIGITVRRSPTGLPEFDIWSSGGGGGYTMSRYRWRQTLYCSTAFDDYEAAGVPDVVGGAVIRIPGEGVEVVARGSRPGDCPRE